MGVGCGDRCEVFFSPHDHLADEFAKMIDSETKSLSIAAYDLSHQAVIPRLAALLGCLFVPKIVRFIDNNEIVVAPVDVGQVDITGSAAIARQISMIQDIVVETIGGKYVPAIVCLVESPVVTQPLWTKNQNPVIP